MIQRGYWSLKKEDKGRMRIMEVVKEEGIWNKVEFEADCKAIKVV